MGHWYLYNYINKTKHGPLEFSEVESKLNQGISFGLENWFSWQQNYPKWLRVTEDRQLKNLIQKLQQKKEIPIATPSKKAPPVPPENSVKSSSPPPPKVKDSERREFPRYDAKFRVIVTNKVNTFISFSKNISLGGIKLEHHVPEYLFSGECEVFIQNPGNRSSVKFNCKAVGKDKAPSRLEFKKVEKKHLELLATWISENAANSKKAG